MLSFVSRIGKLGTGLLVISLTALAALGGDPVSPSAGGVFMIADGDETGLIAAIESANDEAAHPGPDTIRLAPNGTYTLRVAFDPNTPAGLPIIRSDITILGHGSTIERIPSPGTPEFTILYVDEGAQLALHEVTIRGGANAAGAGGIANEGVLTLAGCTLTQNSGFNGGAIWSSGPLKVTGCVLRRNTATRDGAAICAAAGRVWLRACAITDNSAPATAILAYGALELRGCTVGWNQADHAISSHGRLTAADSFISNNLRNGIYRLDLSDSSLATIERCTFAANGSTAIWADSPVAVLSSRLIGNQHGIMAFADLHLLDTEVSASLSALSISRGHLEMTQCTLAANAHGLSVWGATAQVTGCTIANHEHSGLTVHDGGTLTMRNSTITGNQGSGLWIYDSASADLHSCTIYRNSIAWPWGGIHNAGSLTIANSIVAGSVAADLVRTCCDSFTDAGHNLIEDGTGIAHPTSMSDNPLLAPLSDNGGPTHTHALLPGSPAIDAGECSALTNDQRGAARPQGAACDIGAFELQP